MTTIAFDVITLDRAVCRTLQLQAIGGIVLHGISDELIAIDVARRCGSCSGVNLSSNSYRVDWRSDCRVIPQGGDPRAGGSWVGFAVQCRDVLLDEVLGGLDVNASIAVTCHCDIRNSRAVRSTKRIDTVRLVVGYLVLIQLIAGATTL